MTQNVKEPWQTDTMFPSREQYLSLKQKISKDGHERLCDQEKMWNRNYNYAWQIVIADHPWSTENDPMYDAEMTWRASEMFRRWRRHRQRDLPEPAFKTTEQIAHVEECCKLARRYMDHGDVRRRAALRGQLVPAPLPLIDTSWRTEKEIRVERERLDV
jgi:hypothetical protein